jgi:hypothetical protein
MLSSSFYPWLEYTLGKGQRRSKLQRIVLRWTQLALSSVFAWWRERTVVQAINKAKLSVAARRLFNRYLRSTTHLRTHMLAAYEAAGVMVEVSEPSFRPAQACKS